MPQSVPLPEPNAPTPLEPAFADVIVPRHLNRLFTYAVPTALRPRLVVGSQVRVPFGPSMLQGVVAAVSGRLPDHYNRPSAISGRTRTSLREISALVDESPRTGLPPHILVLSRLVCDRYLSPWGQCLRLILPRPRPRSPSCRYALSSQGAQVREHSKHLSSTARAVLASLAAAPEGLSLAALRRRIRGPLTRELHLLKRRRLVREVVGIQASRGLLTPHKPQPRLHAEGRLHPASPDEILESPLDLISSDPTWTRLENALSASQAQTVLLTAPPRSRWVAVLRATEATLSRHRTVLLVFPELARAAAVAGILRSRWGNRIAFLHGELTTAARAQAWDQIRAGSAEVVVGTRSAIFAPVQGLGLIYIDEEEDPLLKEEREPHYHARDVGKLRAQLEQAMLVLGSAHPSLDTLASLEPELLVQPSKLPARAASWVSDTESAPIIEPVDLRGLPYRTQLSDPMIDGIRAALRAGTRSILFLNRRGFASALICRDCGAAPRCNRCDVSLTLHRQARQLSCHYCGLARTPSDTCPSCQAIRLEPVGFGTERIEEELRDLFPDAKVGRLDRDTAHRPGQADAIRRQLSTGSLDILIGTQMLFQGTPLPKVGFVGLPLADAGLHLPDFRAAERTYHGLLDAVGLARSAEEGGRVVLQTYLPTHHAIAAVISRTPGTFYKDELAFRKALGYPPYAHLINLRVTGKNADRVQEAAEWWTVRLREVARQVRASGPPLLSTPPHGLLETPGHPLAQSSESEGDTEVQILGPIVSAVERVRGRHRRQLLVKSVNAEAARQTVKATLDELERRKRWSGLKFEVDVDPVAML